MIISFSIYPTGLLGFAIIIKDAFSILSDEIVGLGYEAPIKTSDKPQIIPLHIWPRKIKELNWNESSFSKNGITFLNIHLIKKSALREVNNKSEENKTSLPKAIIEDRKTGRPSLKNKIIAAYNLLKKEGSIDYSKTLKSHTDLIQKTVQALNPDITGTAGMQHEAIRRAVSKRFQTEKNNL